MHQGNKKLLQVTTFCCCSIFHLWVQWRVQAALNWFTVNPMGCAEAMKPPDSVDVFLPAGVEARCQTRDRSWASDLNTNPSTGHEQMDIQLKAALRAEGLSEWSALSPLEKCWCELFESCSRWRIRASVRTKLPSDWQVDSRLVQKTEWIKNKFRIWILLCQMQMIIFCPRLHYMSSACKSAGILKLW